MTTKKFQLLWLHSLFRVDFGLNDVAQVAEQLSHVLLRGPGRDIRHLNHRWASHLLALRKIR